MKLLDELKIIWKHMFAWKALIYRVGTMGIKFGWGIFFAWLWGHAFGGILMISIMIVNEFIWYGACEHRYGVYRCPGCGHKL